jgi:signal transduction histidine kinase
LVRSQSELLANVSHALRTPLARIRVALDLAAEGDATRAKESLADIEEDLGELERLVDDVMNAARFDLDASRPGRMAPPLRVELVATHSLLEKASQRFRATHPARELKLLEQGHLPTLAADPALLRRAIDNILDNASKYSERPSPILLSAHDDGEMLHVAVQDQGIGIDAADLPRVFTPFFRGDRSRARKTGGAGLGLPLAQRIVEAHGGSIAIESQPGQGTTVRIQIPHQRDQEAA